MPRDHSSPRLVLWQFWISIVQLIAGLYGIGVMAWQINLTYAYSSEYTPAEVALLRTAYGSWLVFWILIVLNDIFMLTADWKRSNTYLGCILAQTIANLCFVILTALHNLPKSSKFAPIHLPEILATNRPFIIWRIFGASVVITGFCSLCLLLFSLWPVVKLRARRIWIANTKDALMGMVSPARFEIPQLLGVPREAAIPNPFVITYRRAKRSLAILFFRRVSPAETRRYAFTRNSFAVVAVGILIFRAVTALQQAQNEISTRATSETCEDISPRHSLAILSDQIVSDSRWDTSFPNITVTISTGRSKLDWGDDIHNITSCTVEWTDYRSTLVGRIYQRRFRQLFDCPLLRNTTLYDDNERRIPWSTNNAVVIIQAHQDPGTPRVNISSIHMPSIWFVNQAEFPDIPAMNSTMQDVYKVQAYLPPFKLLRNSQIEAEANLITRRFIKSSIVKDIIFNSKSVYQSLSLYPIVKSSVALLNGSDARIAAATIRPTMAPGLMYYRNQPDAEHLEQSPDDICDFIEEYRSGTILDVLGSVGGLFALLQSAHLLLFGRPLFWGLSGAKLISPFGLLGSCGSRGFRSRLKEEYHGKSFEDGTDTIKIVKFLRDFVIDFGPADLDPERRTERQSMSPRPSLVGNSDYSTDTRIPLMPMGSDTTVIFQDDRSYNSV